MVATMKDVQAASDEIHNNVAELEPADITAEQDSDTGNTVMPMSTDEVKSKIREVFAELDEYKQERKKANEHLGALREDLVSLGFSKKAQATVAAYMKLNESDQEYFDQSVGIMRAALGKPVQGSLELVQNRTP